MPSDDALTSSSNASPLTSTATTATGGHTTTISVLDIELPGSEQATARVVAA